jgi:hypothetical protein
MNEISAYASASGTDINETVRALRERIGAEAISANEAPSLGTIGGFGGLSSQEILQHPLWDALAASTQSPGNGGGKSEENAPLQDRMLRDLRFYVANKFASLRRKSDEQCPRQSTDSLSLLSQFLACCCEASEGFSSRANAETIPLLANGVKGRVGALRGYGNAIVSQVAAKFVEAVMSV